MLNDYFSLNEPATYAAIWQETLAQGFTMLSDKLTGSFLRTLATSKPGGKMLELGTGTGVGTCWILEGMDNTAQLLTVDNDAALLEIARKHLGGDSRLEIHCDAGENIINQLPAASLDFIFADTWPGKYNHLEETLALLKPGGIYLIDDMLPQPNWPAGHEDKAHSLLAELEANTSLTVTKMHWSTGLLLAVRN